MGRNTVTGYAPDVESVIVAACQRHHVRRDRIGSKEQDRALTNAHAEIAQTLVGSKWYTVQQVAALLNRHRSTVTYWLERDA